jgi:hypothetical protein
MNTKEAGAIIVALLLVATLVAGLASAETRAVGSGSNASSVAIDLSTREGFSAVFAGEEAAVVEEPEPVEEEEPEESATDWWDIGSGFNYPEGYWDAITSPAPWPDMRGYWDMNSTSAPWPDMTGYWDMNSTPAPWPDM